MCNIYKFKKKHAFLENEQNTSSLSHVVEFVVPSIFGVLELVPPPPPIPLAFVVLLTSCFGVVDEDVAGVVVISSVILTLM